MKRRDPGAWLALALLVLCLAPFAGSSVYNNDEFTLLSDAGRILHGQVPYRDFFEFVPPMPLWLLALGASVVGVKVATTHALAAGTMLVAGLQSVAVMRRLGAGRATAWLPAFVLAMGLFPHWAVWSHHWLVIPFELAALLAVLRGLDGTARTPWLLAGVAVGFAGFSMQTDGALCGLSLAAGLATDTWLRRGSWQLLAARLAWMAAGALAVVLAVAGLLAAQGALGAAIEDVIRWPMTQYRQASGINDVRFGTDLVTMLQPITTPPTWYVRVYHVLCTYALLPLAALTALGWWLGQLAARARGAVPAATVGPLGLVAWWSLASLFLAMHGRCDYVHISVYAMPAVLLLAIGADRLPRLPATPGTALLRYLPVMLLWAYAGAGGLGQLKAMQRDPGLWNRPWAPDERLQSSEVIRFLRAQARPGDRQVAVPYGGFFYVYGPPPATRLSLVLPTLFGYGAADEFTSFWAEVARARPRFIVVGPWAWDDWQVSLRTFTERLPAGYHEVGRFPNPQWGNAFPAIVYEADAAKAP